jgi:hypothetical protein
VELVRFPHYYLGSALFASSHSRDGHDTISRSNSPYSTTIAHIEEYLEFMVLTKSPKRVQ